jgi:topoisomerase-4 subunit B
MENLRYKYDCNGCRCRWNAHLLLITFFLQFFPELIKDGHLYILQTLFRVRNKKETIYCYSDEERKVAIEN